MAKQVPFIGRENEIRDIQAWFAETNGSRDVICIQGDGGIGKTRLLQELHKMCISSSSPFSTKVSENQELRIGIVHELTNSEWSQQFKHGLQHMALELGVKLIQTDAVHNVEKMARDILEIIETKPDVIVIRMGNNEKIRPAIEKAIEKCIPVLLFDNYLPRLSSGIAGRIITDDNKDVSQAFDQLAADISFSGPVAAIWTRGANMQERRLTTLENLPLKYPDINIIRSPNPTDTPTSKDLRQKTIELVQNNPDLKAIAVLWDEYTWEVTETLRSLGRHDILIYGFDCYSPRLIDAMRKPDRIIAAIVASNAELIGHIVVRLATSVACHETIQALTSIPALLINAADISLTEKTALNWSNYDIGWTDTLHALRTQTLDQPQTYKVLGIIDLDDRSLHLPQNLQRQIARKMSRDEFIPYLQSIRDYNKIQISGASPRAVDMQRQEIAKAFAECFNHVTDEQRVVIFIDTADALKDDSIWTEMLSYISALENCVIVVAGRTARHVYEILELKLSDKDLHLIQLKHFSDEDSLAYLNKKLELLNIYEEPGVVEKLLFLADGLPILIDLSLEAYARGSSLSWLSTIDLETLKNLPPDKLKIEKKQFEQALMRLFLETSRNLDWLMLALSYVYPMNAEMSQAVLGLSQSEIEFLLSDAQNQVFVKTLPDNRIALHDEMRRMMEEYIWPKLDPGRQRQRHYCKLASEYLEQEIENLLEEIAQSWREANSEDVLEDQSELTQEKENKCWELQLEQVDYALKADINQGMQIFNRRYDDIPQYTISNIRSKMLQLAENALTEVKDKNIDLEAGTYYGFRSRQAGYYIGAFQPETGLSILNELEKENLDVEQRVDLLTRFALYSEKTGKLLKANRYLEDALKLLESDDHPHPEWKGILYNSLGRISRMLGKWENAQLNYSKAIKLLEGTTNEMRLSTAYNNLGYVIGLQRFYDSAVMYCTDALEIQTRNGWVHSSGRTLNTLGIIYRGKREFHKSLEYTQRALEIFQNANNDEWIAQAYGEIGITQWHMGNLSRARDALEHSKKISEVRDIRSNLVNVLHALGHVNWEEGRLTEAERYFKESANLAEEIFDPRQAANSLQGLVELYYDMGYEYHRKGDLGKRDELYEKSLKTAQYWEEKYDSGEYSFTLYSGDRLRTLGNIAFDRKNYDEALEYYLLSYPKTASPWGYSRNLLPEALKKLQDRIEQLEPGQALQWCDRIEKEWKRLGRDKDVPEMMHTCQICRDHAKRRSANQKV
jgi:ABC-type sugar transport system substrate-binding protein/tetratricopeptide (TPR) repeat protein